mmetsp:Transcript_15224/g.20611  ORF Transcript_15224/g.20611 Transcript_15224/m.20611 type:complete len:144 (+) Transcript_15224:554-985(+)
MTCKHYFLLNPEDRLLRYFDMFMLLVILYSCITSAFFTAFDFPSEGFIYNMEHFVFGCFTLDIIFNFMRQYQDYKTNSWVTSHSDIAKRYFKSGWFFFDFIATFPFYLLPQEEDSGSSNLILFKLLRMIRLPRIKHLFSYARF